MVDVQRERKHLLGDLRGDLEHAIVVVRRIQRHRIVQRVTRMIAHVHRRVDREQEEANPQTVHARDQLRIAAHQQRKRLAMAELVIAPVLEPLEDRMEALVRVLLEMAEQRDVARVADLLGQVGRVDDELRAEVRRLLRLRQEAQVHGDAVILQRLVDEACMPRFVARHVAEQLLHVRVRGALLDLRVQQTARILGRDRADHEVHELLAQRILELAHFGHELRGTLEEIAVGVRLELVHEVVELLADRRHVQPVHRGEIRGVEPRTEDGGCRRLQGGFVQFPTGRGLFDHDCAHDFLRQTSNACDL